MEGLWWLLLIVLFFLFGRARTAGGGSFTLDNSVPGPQQLPASTIQNQVDGNPVATPAPWSNPCIAGAAPPSPSGLGLTGGGAMPVNFHQFPVAVTRSTRVTKTTY